MGAHDPLKSSKRFRNLPGLRKLSIMKVILSVVVVALCAAVALAADNDACPTFCKSECETVDLVCNAFPITVACPSIKGECETACDGLCACYTQCVAGCPAVDDSNFLANFFTSSINYGCQGNCATSCKLRSAIIVASEQVAQAAETATAVAGNIAGALNPAP